MRRLISTTCFLVIALAVQPAFVQAQQYFYTFQGSLKDGAAPANGNYEMQFNYCATETGGACANSTFIGGVPVSNGIFSLNLGLNPYLFTPGSNVWIEIRIRPTGSQDPQTVLSPRQRINYVPFAMAALDTQNLGGVAAGQYVLTGDVRLSDARAPTAGSPNYIQNTTTQQTVSNFSISGTGIANILSASQYNIGGGRILGNGGNPANLFAGTFSGRAIGQPVRRSQCRDR